MWTLDSVEVSPEDTRQTFATQEHDCVSQKLEVRCDWSLHSLAWLGIMAGYEGLCMLVSTCECYQGQIKPLTTALPGRCWIKVFLKTFLKSTSSLLFAWEILAKLLRSGMS